MSSIETGFSFSVKVEGENAGWRFIDSSLVRNDMPALWVLVQVCNAWRGTHGNDPRAGRVVVLCCCAFDTC